MTTTMQSWERPTSFTPAEEVEELVDTLCQRWSDAVLPGLTGADAVYFRLEVEDFQRRIGDAVEALAKGRPSLEKLEDEVAAQEDQIWRLERELAHANEIADLKAKLPVPAGANA